MSSAISCQIISIGELLRASFKLTVPPYQRNYAWEEENYADLWTDILETFNDNGEEYFLGSVVLDNSTAPNFTLIDGQQRVTTTTILICALKWHLLSNNLNELATLVTQDFLSKPDYECGTLTPNLVLNLNDRHFFEQHIIPATDPEALIKMIKDESHTPSIQQLAECYQYMAQQIETLLRPGKNLEQVAHDMLRALREKVFVIRIDVVDDIQAFTLFEALNNRGVELSEADLLKNYIFSSAESHIDDLKANWEIMSQNLGHYSMMKFLRHYWNSKEGNQPSQGLLVAIKKRIKTPEQALEFSNRITESSEFYGAIIEPSHALWQRVNIEKIDEIKTCLRQLSMLRAEQCYILLMAILEFAPEKFYDYLIMIRNFTFRYTTIGGKNTAHVGRAYMRAAHAIRTDGAMSANETFSRFFQELYPKDSQFQSTFAKKSIRITALARHILSEINNNLKDEAATPRISEKSNGLDLEHILPKKFRDHWQKNAADFPGGLHKYVHRLGNMTLIAPELNRRLGNASFDIKKEVYKKDCLEVTKRVLEEPIWSADAISRRQNWLASEAVKIWRYPLDNFATEQQS